MVNGGIRTLDLCLRSPELRPRELLTLESFKVPSFKKWAIAQFLWRHQLRDILSWIAVDTTPFLTKKIGPKLAWIVNLSSRRCWGQISRQLQPLFWSGTTWIGESASTCCMASARVVLVQFSASRWRSRSKKASARARARARPGGHRLSGRSLGLKLASLGGERCGVGKMFEGWKFQIKN